MTLYSCSENRRIVISDIVHCLERLKSESDVNQFALAENIQFFKSSISIVSYLRWIIRMAAGIDGKNLLELSDFPLPKWEKETHLQLIEIERREFPGLITPLINSIVEFVLQKKPRILLDFGSGGMEVERQVIKRLREGGYAKRLVFVGVDKSPVVKDIARANLKGFEDVIDIHEVEELTPDLLSRLLASNNAKHAVAMCNNDIFEMDRYFEEHAFDLVFYSMFRHHLSDSQKTSLDRVVSHLARNIMEYDNYKSLVHLISPSIANWRKPPLLNGAVFSRLRAPTRQELAGRKEDYNVTTFFKKTGTYLMKRTLEG